MLQDGCLGSLGLQALVLTCQEGECLNMILGPLWNIACPSSIPLHMPFG